MPENRGNVTATPVILTVYSRNGCHLCEQMISTLQQLQQKFNFFYQVIDIDTDDKLIALYNEHVPVLIVSQNSEEICRHCLDEKALIAYLQNNC